MEGIREIAKTYYERATQEEKKSVNKFFATLDVNGDGKISLQEFKKSASSSLSADSVFEKLDADGDGALDFNEVLCLYYMEKKVKIARCGGCWDLLVGPYFSCLLCLGKGADTYDLCCRCYQTGELEHEHSSSYMLDHHSLIMVLKDRTADAEKSRLKKQMEELREIAKAHYRAGSPEVQALAYEFYQSMDTDGDGRVDLSEFLAFMRQQSYSCMRNTHFFEELDQDSNGTLDFSEVMTLYYIIRSGRPFCDCCGKFIPGIFFSCVECFKNPETSFDVCPDCYRSTKCKHSHDGRAQFLDNYSLLHAKRDSDIAQATRLNTNEPWTSSSNSMIPVQQSNMYINTNYSTTYNSYVVHPPNQAPSYSNAIVPASNNWIKWKAALTAFEVALGIGYLSGTMCTIM